jgi:hypothetical protein
MLQRILSIERATQESRAAAKAVPATEEELAGDDARALLDHYVPIDQLHRVQSSEPAPASAPAPSDSEDGSEPLPAVIHPELSLAQLEEEAAEPPAKRVLFIHFIPPPLRENGKRDLPWIVHSCDGCRECAPLTSALLYLASLLSLAESLCSGVQGAARVL